MGLKIIKLGNSILINNPFNSVAYNQNLFALSKSTQQYLDDNAEDDESVELYKEDDYFLDLQDLKL